MKKILFIISALLVAVTSQAEVRELIIGAANNSIIRTVDDQKVLIYTQQTVDTGYFVLFEHTTNNALAFQVPTGWAVHDIRIYDGTTAYFCGTYNGQGLIGMFRIATVFAGTDNVKYAICGMLPHGGILVTDLMRLDLFEYGGYVHMAMTGTTDFNSVVHPMYGTTVVWARYDGVSWKYRGFYNKDGLIQFTDIACLGDIIVAVGPDTNGMGCYMKTFEQTTQFTRYPINYGYVTQLTYDDPVSDVLAVRKENNTALLAQYNKKNTAGTTLYEVALSPTTGEPTLPALDVWRSDYSADKPYAPTWRMRELNWHDNHAWLLERADYVTPVLTGLADWLLKVPLLSPWGTAQLWYPHTCNAQSMDIGSYHTQPWLSGNTPGLAIYLPPWLNTGLCYRYTTFNFNNDVAVWSKLKINEGDEEVTPHYQFALLTLFQVRVDIICQ